MQRAAHWVSRLAQQTSGPPPPAVEWRNAMSSHNAAAAGATLLAHQNRRRCCCARGSAAQQPACLGPVTHCRKCITQQAHARVTQRRAAVTAARVRAQGTKRARPHARANHHPPNTSTINTPDAAVAAASPARTHAVVAATAHVLRSAVCAESGRRSLTLCPVRAAAPTHTHTQPWRHTVSQEHRQRHGESEGAHAGRMRLAAAALTAAAPRPRCWLAPPAAAAQCRARRALSLHCCPGAPASRRKACRRLLRLLLHCRQRLRAQVQRRLREHDAREQRAHTVTHCHPRQHRDGAAL